MPKLILLNPKAKKLFTSTIERSELRADPGIFFLGDPGSRALALLGFIFFNI
jgi:hypothetical protein